MGILITIIVVLIAGLLSLFFLRKPLSNYFSSITKRIIDENLKATEQNTKEIFKEERERMMDNYRLEKELMEEKLKKGEQFIEGKKDSIKDMVDKLHQELLKTQMKTDESEKERIGEFKTLKTVLDEYKIITGGLKDSADNLKNVLSNNQLRGSMGEEVAENLLNSIGFIRGQHYEANVVQDTVATRPDFTIRLPDGTKVNIDVKFPLQALIKYQETDNKQEKDRYLREFTTDVKQKIKEITSRDYINPEENTVDFVILFVPNEMIFSFIYDKLNEVWNDGLKKKVILTGPFSFAAILRMIFQSYKNFKYQQDLYVIIKLIKSFEEEYNKFSVELDKLGVKIQATESQFQTVSTTRNKKLLTIIDKIKDEDVLPQPEEIKKLDIPPII